MARLRLSSFSGNNCETAGGGKPPTPPSAFSGGHHGGGGGVVSGSPSCSSMLGANSGNNAQLMRLRVVVLGARQVGKSALTVRYLTKRFIGEYKSFQDLMYRQTMCLDNVQMEMEIIDISDKKEGSAFPHNHARWGEAFIVVYSVTDPGSLKHVKDVLEKIRRIKGHQKYVPILILGNKRDLEHARKVDVSSGELLAMQQGCQFAEVSAAESAQEVTNAFQAILREARAWKFEKNLPRQRKLSMLAVSKMLNSLIRKTSAPAFPTKTQMFICPDSGREALKDFEELLKEVERGTPPPFCLPSNSNSSLVSSSSTSSSSSASSGISLASFTSGSSSAGTLGRDKSGKPLTGDQILRKMSVYAPRDYQMLIISGSSSNGTQFPSNAFSSWESSWEVACGSLGACGLRAEAAGDGF